MRRCPPASGLPLAAAALALWLAAPGGPAGAQDDDPGHGDAGEQGTVWPGPVTRRPPPVDEPVPESPAEAGAPDEAAAAPDPGAGGSVLEVLDASVFEGVFAPYTVRDGREVPEPLAGIEGDPVAGRRLFHNFSRTGCSLCHGTPEAPRPDDSDRTAPDLHRVAERLSPGYLRLWIISPQAIRPEATMPAFHKPGQRENPADPLYGGPRLTAAEVEHIVAYLANAGGAE